MISLLMAAKGMLKVAIFFPKRRARSFETVIVQDEDVEQRLAENRHHYL